MRSRPRMAAPGDSDQRRASWAWTAGEDEMAESITPSPRLRGASARSCPRHDLNDAGRRSPDAGRGEGQLRAAALVAGGGGGGGGGGEARGGGGEGGRGRK